MGVSFALTKQAQKLSISVKTAYYSLLEEVDPESKKQVWERQPLEIESQTIDVAELCEQKKLEFSIDEGLKIIFFLHKVYSDGSKTVTATLINTYKDRTKADFGLTSIHIFSLR